MSEPTLLRVLLLASLAIGPLGNRLLFSHRGRDETASHVVALACAAAGLFTGASFLTRTSAETSRPVTKRGSSRLPAHRLQSG